MGYEEVFNRIRDGLKDEIKWWPRYFYHFTDVHNVPGILSTGWIYSRSVAIGSGMLKHDNASQSVIEATMPVNKTYGRLYFRPLTPTQYNNEGYKPPSIAYQEIGGNCPVPVFICLDSLDTMRYPGVKFAEKGLSGDRDTIAEGEEAFVKLHFEKIYHYGVYGTEDRDIKDYRHSEIIREGGMPINPLLRGIMCRTAAEKETLKNLLLEHSPMLYERYAGYISYDPKYRFFYNNGIFISKVELNDELINILLNDRTNRRILNPDVTNAYIDVHISAVFMGEDRLTMDVQEYQCQIDYRDTQEIWFRIRRDKKEQSRNVLIEICFDRIVMYKGMFAAGDIVT